MITARVKDVGLPMGYYPSLGPVLWHMMNRTYTFPQSIKRNSKRNRGNANRKKKPINPYSSLPDDESELMDRHSWLFAGTARSEILASYWDLG
jgi:hypothetical protein